MGLSRSHAYVAAFLLTIVGVIAAAIWWPGPSQESPAVFRREPVGIMGTRSSLVAIAASADAAGVGHVLDAAEAELRRLEGLFSTWIEASQMTRVNEAKAGEWVSIPGEIRELLDLSERLFVETSGAFDVTAGPLIERWRRAGRDNALPSDAELRSAREASGWHQFELGPDGITKKMDSARADIDGIAKGRAIDRALEVLIEGGLRGGMVEVGGDLRVFGRGPDGDTWLVSIQSPFEDRVWARIELGEGAICSSGDYARYVEIGGKRYSHIVDPRDGRPVEGTPTVTVVGPEAAAADAWATALSVLGPSGLDLLPIAQGFEAMVVSGSPDAPVVNATPGFISLLVESDFEVREGAR